MLCSAIPRIFDKIDKLQRMVNGEESAEVSFISFFPSLSLSEEVKKGENYGDRLTIKALLWTQTLSLFTHFSLSLSQTHTLTSISLLHTRTHTTHNTLLFLSVYIHKTHIISVLLFLTLLFSLYSLYYLSFSGCALFFHLKRKELFFWKRVFRFSILFLLAWD